MEFSYITYIGAHTEKVWQALTDPETSTKYFFGRRVKSTWRVGSPIEYLMPNGQVDVFGTLLEIKRGRLLAYTFDSKQGKHVEREQPTRVRIELKPLGPITRLRLVHDELLEIDLEKNYDTFAGINNGWPAILSNLKSVIETGQPVLVFAKPPTMDDPDSLKPR
jgi:uncharacterized protein YndB with AHSA1/START domain